jgi:predicted DNA-binding protein
MEKLLGQLATHVSTETERQIRALAELRGVSASEYLREIITAHLDVKKLEYQALKEAFETPAFSRCGEFGEFAKKEIP